MLLRARKLTCRPSPHLRERVPSFHGFSLFWQMRIPFSSGNEPRLCSPGSSTETLTFSGLFHLSEHPRSKPCQSTKSEALRVTHSLCEHPKRERPDLHYPTTGRLTPGTDERPVNGNDSSMRMQANAGPYPRRSRSPPFKPELLRRMLRGLPKYCSG